MGAATPEMFEKFGLERVFPAPVPDQDFAFSTIYYPAYKLEDVI